MTKNFKNVTSSPLLPSPQRTMIMSVDELQWIISSECRAIAFLFVYADEPSPASPASPVTGLSPLSRRFSVFFACNVTQKRYTITMLQTEAIILLPTCSSSLLVLSFLSSFLAISSFSLTPSPTHHLPILSVIYFSHLHISTTLYTPHQEQKIVISYGDQPRCHL